jgi:hypothetical protein
LAELFKLIRRLIGIILIAAIAFLALSLWQGGKPFRWFGKQSEQAGEIVRQKSEEAGEKADTIKKRTEDMKETTKKVTGGIKKTGEKIRDITGSGTGK